MKISYILAFFNIKITPFLFLFPRVADRLFYSNLISRQPTRYDIEGEMEETSKGNNYKSPQRKLVKFFEKSRNQWKGKCQEAKSRVKKLNNRIRFLEKSKDQWKRRVKEVEEELTAIKSIEQAREKELEALKKTT